MRVTTVEKVLQAMEHCDLCSDMPNCPECAYLREPDCMEMLKRDIITLLKVREPLWVTHIHEEYPEHDWYRNEDGTINVNAMDCDTHIGPVCKRCGDSFCVFCEPNGFETHKPCVIDKYVCPECGRMVFNGQKYCSRCGRGLIWHE